MPLTQTQLVQSIATQASSDLDLGRLALTSPTFATQLNPDNAGIWRKRFLARYDYPILHKVHEFAIAYKVRRFILRKLDGRAFALGQSDRAEHQLLVIKDMVLGEHRLLQAFETLANVVQRHTTGTNPISLLRHSRRTLQPCPRLLHRPGF